MPGKARSHTERLARIFDHLGEHIRSVPSDELLEAAREDGRDPGEVNSRIKGILSKEFKSQQQKSLAEAREGYKRELTRISESHFDLPITGKERRNLFLATLAQAPQLQSAFTLQNRDLSELSDEDIESHLKTLAQLGVLKSTNPSEEE